jgi:hypothetical protein
MDSRGKFEFKLGQQYLRFVCWRRVKFWIPFPSYDTDNKTNPDPSRATAATSISITYLTT